MRQVIRKQSIDEAFQNFKYRMPDDPELMLYDFYFMSVIANNVNLDSEPETEWIIKQAVEKLVEEMHTHISRSLKWSLSCEIRHIFDGAFSPSSNESQEMFKQYPKFSIEYYKALKSLGTSQKLPDFLISLDARDSEEFFDELANRFEQDPMVYKDNSSERLKSNKAIKMVQRKVGISNLELAQLYQDFYYGGYWGNHSTSFGGEKWGDIAKGWYNLLKAKTTQQKIIWIDHAYDLQHNTSTVFNKIQGYVKSGGYLWIFKALEWKKWVKDPRQFYYKVSPQLKGLVAYISKNNYGLAIDSFTGIENPASLSPSQTLSSTPAASQSQSTLGASNLFIPMTNEQKNTVGLATGFTGFTLTAASKKAIGVNPNDVVYVTSFLADKVFSSGYEKSPLVKKIKALFSLYYVGKFVLLGTPEGKVISVKAGELQIKKIFLPPEVQFIDRNFKFSLGLKINAMGTPAASTSSSTPAIPTLSPTPPEVLAGWPASGSSNDPSEGKGIPYAGANRLKFSELQKWGLNSTSIDWTHNNVWISQALLNLAKSKYTKIKWIFLLELKNVYIHYNRGKDEAEVIGLGVQKSAVSGWWKKGNLKKASFKGTWKNGMLIDSKFISGDWKNGLFHPSSEWVSGTWEKGYHTLFQYETNQIKYQPPGSLTPSSAQTSSQSNTGDGIYEGADAESRLKTLFNDDSITISQGSKIKIENGVVTWLLGIWFQGTWKGGTWVEGTWEGGTWEGGTWGTGNWKDGTWLDGEWSGGTWRDGVWYKGLWRHGLWENGTWYDGTWLAGEWKAGIWHDGLWESGSWKGGTWQKGSWLSGVWYEGTWNGGTWANGQIGSQYSSISTVPPNQVSESINDSESVYLKENSIETHLRLRRGWD